MIPQDEKSRNEQIESAFKNAHETGSLNFENFHLTKIEFERIVSFLRDNETKVTFLNLNGNALGDEEAIVLAEVLKINSTLTYLTLGKTDIGADGTMALAKALSINQSVADFDLDIPNAEVLAEFLEIVKNNITLVLLGDWRGGPLRDHPESQKLIWRNQKLVSLSKAFKEARETNILTLNFLSTKEEVENVFSFLQNPANAITSLNLSWSSLGDEGALVIAQALEGPLQGIHSLNLGHCEIGTDGITAIAKALSTNETLTTLNLSSNLMKPGDALILLQALEKNTTLTTLDFSQNPLGHHADLVDALSRNKALCSLGDFRVEEEIHRKPIEEILERNRIAILAKSRNMMAKLFTQKRAEKGLAGMVAHMAGIGTKRGERQLEEREYKIRQENISMLDPVDRIVSFIDELSENVEKGGVPPSIMSDISIKMRDIINNASHMGYVFNFEQKSGDAQSAHARVKAAIERFKHKNQQCKEIARKLEDEWQRVKDEYNVWNSADRIVNFINSFTNRLEQQDEIDIINELNEANTRIQDILAYNREMGVKQYRQSDAKSIQAKIETLKNEVQEIKNKAEILEHEELPIHDAIIENTRETGQLSAAVNTALEKLKDKRIDLKTLNAIKKQLVDNVPLLKDRNKQLFIQLEEKTTQRIKLQKYAKVLNAFITNLETQCGPLLNPTPEDEMHRKRNI